jgi:polyisoprenoid-binding protein YceI
MKKIIIACLLIAAVANLKAQLYSTQSGEISFYSKTPVEDIEAKSKRVLAVLNTEKLTVAFKVDNTSFEFPNKLMQEHFNEKYMESEKYPNSSFAGKINEAVDLTKDGEYPVTVSGKLNIHGVEQDRTIPGKVVVKNGEITVLSDFKVKVADHKITIPKLVVAKIAEEISVNVNAVMQPKK